MRSHGHAWNSQQHLAYAHNLLGRRPHAPHIYGSSTRHLCLPKTCAAGQAATPQRAVGIYGFCSAECRSRCRSQQFRDGDLQEGMFNASAAGDQAEGYPLELSCTYTKSVANVPLDTARGQKNAAITALLRRIKQATGTLGQPGYKVQLKPFGAQRSKAQS